MAEYPQENTILAIATPFGDGAVLLVRFFAEERISALFRFDLEMLSPDSALDFDAIVGEGVTVTIRRGDGGARYFHGIVGRFVQAGTAGKQTSYRAEVYPWLWLLTKTRDSRIFQDQSVPEIIEAVFGELGFSDYKSELKASYAPREYCVQYQESAFNFISRLMEDEGIYYYFKHEDGKHTLVLGDDSPSNPPCPDLPAARYVGDAGDVADEDAVTECTIEQRIVAGSYAVGDYNFEMPTASLLATVEGKDGKSSKLKMFEYPGSHASKGAGEARAKIRIEAEEAMRKRLSGRSLCREFSAGHTFELTEHDRDDVNAEYALRSVTHMATGEDYSNTFEAFPKDASFRPARVAQKPYVAGSETALVVGKSGEEIWTDEHGRVKVQFYWDRLGAKDEKSSCWVRVAQGWAGKGWGSFFLPRIGQEVIVSFLGGDPDRPLITGVVYNAEQTVPYALPAEQTKSTIMGRSTKEGDAGNEIRFEDKKDSEELYLHAQKDMTFEVKNDWVIKVLHDQKSTVKGNRTATIEEGDESLTVTKGNRAIAVKAGDETYSVKGARTLTVEGDEAHTNKSGFTRSVKKDYTIKVDGNLILDVKGTITIKAGKSLAVKAGTEIAAEAGTSMTSKAGTTMTNKAGTSLTNEAGVSLTSKAGASQTIDGGGMLTVKGGLVKIN